MVCISYARLEGFNIDSHLGVIGFAKNHFPIKEITLKVIVFGDNSSMQWGGDNWRLSPWSV